MYFYNLLWPVLLCFFYQAISILEGLIPKKEDGSNVSASHLERLYIFCVMWSVGALLELDDRAKMEEFTRANFELDLPPIAEGSQDTIFEFLVNEAGSCYVLYFLLTLCYPAWDVGQRGKSVGTNTCFSVIEANLSPRKSTKMLVSTRFWKNLCDKCPHLSTKRSNICFMTFFLSFSQGVGNNIFVEKTNFKINCDAWFSSKLIAMLVFSMCNFHLPRVLTFQVIGNTGTNGWRSTSTPRITTPTSCPFWSQTWIMCEQTTSFMLCPNRERFGTILACFYLFIFRYLLEGSTCFDCRSLRNKLSNVSAEFFANEWRTSAFLATRKLRWKQKLFARTGTLGISRPWSPRIRLVAEVHSSSYSSWLYGQTSFEVKKWPFRLVCMSIPK